MRQVFVALAAIALTGCVSKVLTSDESSVIVRASRFDASGAFNLAKPECEKHGLKARLNSRPVTDNEWVFDCIK